MAARPGISLSRIEVLALRWLAVIACLAVWALIFQVATTRLDLPPIPAKEAHP